MKAVPENPGGIALSSGPDLEDEQLIEAILSGDRSVAQHIYERLYPVVDRTLCRVVGARGADHEDLVQSSLERVVMTVARKRFARACSLSTWAATIATHVAIDVLRRRQRDRAVFVPHRDPPEVGDVGDSARNNPEGVTIARRELARVRHELAKLRPERARILVLHDVLGYELSEIAVLTETSVSAAQSRLVRGRKQLRARLEAKEREDG